MHKVVQIPRFDLGDTIVTDLRFTKYNQSGVSFTAEIGLAE